MAKQPVAEITVRFMLEPGYCGTYITDWISHVENAIEAFKFNDNANTPAIYADVEVVKAKLFDNG
jgi:hypothetical protein